MTISKKTPILIIGFGSIGKRHFKNLSAMGYGNITIFDPINDAFKGFDARRLKNLNPLAAKNYKIALICSPNNLHIKHALVCAKAGCHLFIEKPLSHNLKNINNLIKICKKNNLITMIGCNMRFHPCLKFIKEYLNKNKLGMIYNINHEFGYYLPYWRPGNDYRKNYAAKKSTGGGIILDDIHEFDLLFWLNNFNKTIKNILISNRASNLEIQTEDQAAGVFLFRNKVLGVVSCNYLEQGYNRKCKIIGEKGSLLWDFKANTVLLITKEKMEIIYKIEKFDFNQVYIDEMKYFFDCVSKNLQTFNNIKTALDILKYCV